MISSIDGLRYIEHLQTTARQLWVFSAIVRVLHKKQLPKRLVEELLVDWSIKEELRNPYYKSSKGKITNEEKKTSALRYHLEAAPALGLVRRFNDVYSNTKFSEIFFYFLSSEDSLNQRLSISEKLFYSYQLLSLDADPLLSILGQLIDTDKKNQKKLQEEFKNRFNERLLLKMKFSPKSVHEAIAERYRIINFKWTKAAKYAEHIIAPRCEWLADLGLVAINREKNSTFYSITKTGEKFYSGLPSFGTEEKIKDISDDWIAGHFFSFYAQVFDNSLRKSFGDLSCDQQNIVLNNSLEHAAKAVISSMSFKLPLLEALIFISFDLLINHNIIANFKDIEEKFVPIFVYNGKNYLLKKSGRINEGYILISIKHET